jgi:hypothetical protein
MRHLTFLAIAGLVMMGCDSSVTEFVKGGGDLIRDIAQPVFTQSSPVGVKVSPGHIVSTSGGLTMEATVTPTNRVLKSADNTMSMEVTVGRGPTSTVQ